MRNNHIGVAYAHYHIALYFRGPKLSRLEHTKLFHEIFFTISAWYGPSLLRVLQFQLHQSWQQIRMMGFL